MTHEPDDFPPEFIAAYVDGELGAGDRARVERWLADHPEARELLETQEALAASNGDLWLALTPPQPCSRQWAQRYHRIACRLQPARRNRRWAALVIAAMVVATTATVLVVVTSEPVVPTIVPRAPTVLAAANESPYPMAADNEVRIISLPEAAATLLVVGAHPLADSDLVLAQADEVEFFGVGSDLAGRFPERPGDSTVEKVPVLWAPRDP